ncbi:MAG: transglycosylase [Candidatus Accumulibacter meliphilus]|jgi:hypothetical protein|uniref:transglycosylase n=1 Tax=Candidatus Accumulibacter meliphilus TaxID=2211374 RepID=UPI002FC38C1E
MKSGQHLNLPQSERQTMEAGLRRQARIEGLEIEISVTDNGNGTVNFAWTVSKANAASVTPTVMAGGSETGTNAATAGPSAGINMETAPITPTFRATGEPEIAFGKKVSGEFKTKVITIATELGVNVDYLMAAMAFETGGTFNPAVKSLAGSGATGLIQFMPKTAIGLGTSTDDLAKMTAVTQLDYVKKYFLPYQGRLKQLEDVYMAILWPKAVGKDNDFVLFAAPSMAYQQNKGLDSNKDGKVTKAEAAAKVRAKLNEGLKPASKG